MNRPNEPADHEPADGAPALALPAELTVYTVGELHPQWLSWLAACADTPQTDANAPVALCVQAEAVDQVDAAGVQLLLALQRQLSDQGRALTIAAPSQVLQKACASLGLADWLARHGAAPQSVEALAEVLS